MRFKNTYVVYTDYYYIASYVLWACVVNIPQGVEMLVYSTNSLRANTKATAHLTKIALSVYERVSHTHTRSLVTWWR